MSSENENPRTNQDALAQFLIANALEKREADQRQEASAHRALGIWLRILATLFAIVIGLPLFIGLVFYIHKGDAADRVSVVAVFAYLAILVFGVRYLMRLRR